MTWDKIGIIYCPSGEFKWMKSHAAVPIAEFIEDDLYKIYFSSRDDLNRSYTCYVVIDITNPKKILEISSTPTLKPGQLGEFDDSGSMATWLVNCKNQRYLYYAGWNLGVTVPFRNSIGLSISTDGKEFKRFSSGPIVDRTVSEPHFCGSCCVIPGDDFWRMWYLNCIEWRMTNGQPQHRYHLKYAESIDGINWHREGVIAIELANEEELSISRPSVLYENGKWKMWYSYRGISYRIGYAESDNGRDWIRMDNKAGIDVAKSGWDSDMIEYPFVFDHKGQKFMLYNGNGYGKTGFGLATLK